MKLKTFSRIIGITFLLISAGLTFIAYQKAVPEECVFPQGSSIDGVDVSGLTKSQTVEYLKSVFEQPVSFDIDEINFNFTINDLGVTINYDQMVSGLNCESEINLTYFWKSLWNKSQPEKIESELVYSLDENKLQSLIDQRVAPYVIIDPKNPVSIEGTTRFQAGMDGTTFYKQVLINKIEAQIGVVDRQTFQVATQTISAPLPDTQQIKEKVNAILRDENFNGAIEIYAQRLSDHEEIQILDWFGEEKDPGVAFTAASTMKIPIMVSTYWRQNLPLSDIMNGWLDSMIILSENDPADRLMEQIDPDRGPLDVTSDVEKLGLENTFIAGYFYLGAPLLNLYETPANLRTDTFTNPDVYNQTTPEDIGHLLEMIYTCSEDESAELISLTQGQISQEECKVIIDTLEKNQMGALIEAGLPEGVSIAHKHGWSQEKDGLVHSFSDVAIVYGPENDFVLTIFTYSSDQLLFDVANPLIARVSQTIYNGFNPNYQISWPFAE